MSNLSTKTALDIFILKKDIVSINLIMDNIRVFPTKNQIYKKYFQKPTIRIHN